MARRRRNGDGPVMTLIYLLGMFGPLILIAFMLGRNLL